VIIAAMERELLPLVRGWKTASFKHQTREYRAYENNNVVALAGGIGARAAAHAATAAVAQYQPAMLVSVGFAGALIRSLKVGNVISPNVIVDAASRNEYRCDAGGGVLVSAVQISDSASKEDLVEKFHALAVDMEAAAVAEIARTQHIGFRCVKAISDEADFVLPPLNRFVDGEGNFQSARFALWAVLRPWRWPQVMALARNSHQASKALCSWLRQSFASGFQPATVARLESSGGIEIGETNSKVLHPSGSSMS
jgi:adenosylhomocysteine nucleosidase